MGCVMKTIEIFIRKVVADQADAERLADKIKANFSDEPDVDFKMVLRDNIVLREGKTVGE